ncbi:hypothetical protein DSCA_23260 [Desulfosarcina alkanivorans]|jgi:glycosyltransferase involved in cell wall biosynthesis|uniref:Glycosyltransferase 2-like domain-containing protein n=1 Tax=Desulfosarcina alkanivorans TaxID=571177 RepID=A0A5K7YH02_9BACT|nr:glycosyltransferase family 2 protein [Desulfosarcina alkanivorans]BBO68396.1 hypothetical protein DSCA_23260 [Desulfosarcina alkanivorans]
MMSHSKETISIILTAYNRAHTVGRAIDSVLSQTYQDLELIVVDDGSSDNTQSKLELYQDERIRIISHSENRGVTEAKNTGLDQIRGTWFTFLDSDDEMVPEALERMISVPDQVDEKINAITCNCFDTSTGEFSGKGLNANQFLSSVDVARKCTGEFWGLTKTELLGVDRFNEKLPGFEDTLWFKINERACRYYLHEGLRIYHTEGEDMITKNLKTGSFSILNRQAFIHRILKEETHYLRTLKIHNPKRFLARVVQGIATAQATGDKDTAQNYRQLSRSDGGLAGEVISWLFFVGGKPMGQFVFHAVNMAKSMRLKANR